MPRIISLVGIFLIITSCLAYAETLYVFQGNINFVQRYFQLEVNSKNNEKFLAELRFIGDEDIYLKTKIEHLKMTNLDISTNLESACHLIKDKVGKIKNLKGWFWTNYSLLNHKQTKELTASFEINKNMVRIDSLVWGEVSLSGDIELLPPYNLNLLTEINEIEVEEFKEILGLAKEDEFFLSNGSISGKLKIIGSRRNPRLRGQLKALNGQLQDINYSELLLNFEGVYPILNISDDSSITEEGMVYNLEGNLDLHGLNDLNSSKNDIKVAALVGVDSRERTWTIQRKKVSPSQSVEFGYKSKSDLPSGLRLREKEDILGFEHKIKF